MLYDILNICKKGNLIGTGYSNVNLTYKNREELNVDKKLAEKAGFSCEMNNALLRVIVVEKDY